MNIWIILFSLALALAFLAIWRAGRTRVDLIQAERETAAWHSSWLDERMDNVVLREQVAELKAKIAPFDRDGDGSPGGSRSIPGWGEGLETSVPVTEPAWLNVGGTPSKGGSIVTADVS